MSEEEKNLSSLLRKKENRFLKERWLSTLIDYICLFGLVYIAAVYTPKIIYQITLFFTVLVYFPLFETLYGKTFGKYLVGISIVNKEGNKPNAIQSIIRTLCRYVEVNPFIGGGIIAGFFTYITKHGQRAGDIVAKTFVVSDKLLAEYKETRL